MAAQVAAKSALLVSTVRTTRTPPKDAGDNHRLAADRPIYLAEFASLHGPLRANCGAARRANRDTTR